MSDKSDELAAVDQQRIHDIRGVAKGIGVPESMVEFAIVQGLPVDTATELFETFVEGGHVSVDGREWGEASD